jgi:hypothetical protein
MNESTNEIAAHTLTFVLKSCSVLDFSFDLDALTMTKYWIIVDVNESLKDSMFDSFIF